MAENYVNNAATTLNGALNNSVTSVVVASATGFPSAGNFRIVVDSELMLVTGVSGTTFTVTRGAESTAAASHLSGAAVTQVLTAGALDQIRADHIASDTTANRPAAAKAGNLFLPTDGILTSRDTGAALVNWGGLKPLGTAINDGSYSWVNQNSGTTTTTFGGVFLFAPKNASDQIRARVAAVPAAPYTRVLALQPFLHNSNFCQCGLCLRDSGTGKFILFGPGANGGSVIDVSYWTNATTFSTRPGSFPMPTASGLGGIVYLKLNDDNANLNFSWSLDGSNWLLLASFVRTAFLAAGGDQLGYFVHVNNNTWDAGCLFLGLT